MHRAGRVSTLGCDRGHAFSGSAEREISQGHGDH
jgi:hypothetical protein